MRRYNFLVSAMAVVALVLASLTVSSAAPGVRNYGPFAGGSPDSGTCGYNWANDTYNRFFKVVTDANPGGTYTVTEDFRQGSFETIDGPSPAACDPVAATNGHVGAGVVGKLSGTFNIIVYHGNYDATATILDLDKDGKIGTADFIGSVFGTGATYDVQHFNFQYTTKNNGSWINSDTGNSGDIISN